MKSGLLLLCGLQFSLGFQPERDAIAIRLPRRLPLLVGGEPNILGANALSVVRRVSSVRCRWRFRSAGFGRDKFARGSGFRRHVVRPFLNVCKVSETRLNSDCCIFRAVTVPAVAEAEEVDAILVGADCCRLAFNKHRRRSDTRVDFDLVGENRQLARIHDCVLSQLLGMKCRNAALQNQAVRENEHAKIAHASIDPALNDPLKAIEFILLTTTDVFFDGWCEIHDEISQIGA
jgi:hypothetical protein